MSTQTAQHQIQAAMYGLMMPGGSLDSVLASIGVTAVLDFRNVPNGQAFPYITLGDGYEIPDNALQKRFYTYIATLHIFSAQPGTAEGSAILARLNTLFDQQPLILSSHTHVSTMYERATWLADPMQFVTHVAVKYRITTQEG